LGVSYKQASIQGTEQKCLLTAAINEAKDSPERQKKKKKELNEWKI
jgi:hypothetical protein